LTACYVPWLFGQYDSESVGGAKQRQQSVHGGWGRHGHVDAAGRRRTVSRARSEPAACRRAHTCTGPRFYPLDCTAPRCAPAAKRVLGWPKYRSWPVHSCGNTAGKGWGWPSFWANSASFSLAVYGDDGGRPAVDAPRRGS
jgi:hypothetical protein